MNTGRVDAGAFEFNARLYNGGLPGPTYEFNAGDTVRIKLVNQLGPNPSDENEHNHFRTPNTTNLHTHGLHIGSSTYLDEDGVAVSADDMFVNAEPGGYVQYEYKVHSEHLAGTHWYHPHHHGSTALQLGGGMAGAIIVKDNVTTAPVALTSLEDVLMVMQYINFGTVGNGDPPSWPSVGLMDNQGGALMDNLDIGARSNSDLDTAPSGTGEIILVNGKAKPTATMQPGQWQRWRLASTYHRTCCWPLSFCLCRTLAILQLTLPGTTHQPEVSCKSCHPSLNPKPQPKAALRIDWGIFEA